MKQYISVVIPTIQKNISILQYLINILNDDSAVSEIIVINNALKPFSPDLNAEKLKIVTPKTNMYVNASWNYGISIIKNDKFLLINDDILCPQGLCTQVLESGILDDPNTGLVGIDTSFMQNYNISEVDNSFFDIDTSKTDITFNIQNLYIGTGDWGSAIFGNKKSYFEIPNIFTIIFGDNYLLYKNLLYGRANYKLSGRKFNHVHSLSSNAPEFNDIITRDCIAGRQYFGV